LCYYAPEGSVILLEQPEAQLHPRAQAALADVFIDVAKTRNIQIILESHSEHLLTRLQRRMAEFNVSEKGIASDQVALYFCKKEGADAQLEELKLNKFGFITNWPEDFFGNEMAERGAMVDATIERQERGEAA
jgi:predicted ATPase